MDGQFDFAKTISLDPIHHVHNLESVVDIFQCAANTALDPLFLYVKSVPVVPGTGRNISKCKKSVPGHVLQPSGLKEYHKWLD